MKSRNVLKKLIRFVVENELVGEAGFFDELPKIAVVGYGVCDMGIAAENDRYALLTAETQYLYVVGTCLQLSARGYEAAVVDFEQSACLACSLDYGGEVELGSTVAGVADDLCPRITYGLYHAVGVLLTRATFPA